MPVSVTNIISAEEAQAASWQIPEVDGPRFSRGPRPTAAALEGIERVAWDEGFAKGHQAGLAAGQNDARRINDELRQKVTHLNNLLQVMVKPMEQLDDSVEQLLVQLALSIAKHLVRRELRVDPSQVIAIVRETVGLLPLEQRAVRVHLHPLDATLVLDSLSDTQSERAWTIVEDPLMSRGGCRVSTDTAQIDASLDARMAALMTEMLGEERARQIRTAAAESDLGNSAEDQSNA